MAQGAGVVGILLGPPEMLQEPVLEKSSTTLGELENSGVFMLMHPEELTLQALSRTKGLQSVLFMDGHD